MTNDILVPPAEPASSRLWPHRKSVVGIAVVVLVVALLALGFRWVNGLNLMSYGNRIEATASSTQALGIDVGISPGVVNGAERTSVPVTLRSVTPRVAVNTANASIDLLLCTITPDGPGRMGVILDPRLGRFCEPYVSLTGEVDDYDDSSSYVAAIVTPTRPGLVQIRGFDVEYSQGLRFGSEPAGTEIVLRFESG